MTLDEAKALAREQSHNTCESGYCVYCALYTLGRELKSAENVLRQVSRDTFGDELPFRKFADMAAYDT